MEKIHNFAKVAAVAWTLALSGCGEDNGTETKTNATGESNAITRKIETDITRNDVLEVIKCAKRNTSNWREDIFDDLIITWTNNGFSTKIIKIFEDSTLLITQDTSNNVSLNIYNGPGIKNFIIDRNADGTLYNNSTNPYISNDRWGVSNDIWGTELSLEGIAHWDNEEIDSKIREIYETVVLWVKKVVCSETKKTQSSAGDTDTIQTIENTDTVQTITNTDTIETIQK